MNGWLAAAFDAIPRFLEQQARCARLVVAALAALLLTTPPMTAFAWGPEGHEVIALIAQQQLTPEAKAAVEALLALEPDATLASISTWADRTRDKSTAAWHYVNLPRDADCNYVAARDCPDGNCVVAALEAQVQRLRSASSASPADRLEALKWVVHLVADVHQPLHAGFADDRGGNTYQLQAFGRGTNLHQLWDSGLIREIDSEAASLANKLIGTGDRTVALAFAPAQWARESCRIVGRADFYPERLMPIEYAQTFEPVVRQQLYAAGVRLAATLNRVFAASAVSDSGSAPRPIEPLDDRASRREKLGSPRRRGVARCRRSPRVVGYALCRHDAPGAPATRARPSGGSPD